MSEKVQGTVKWFNETKGYGFIAPDSGPDVFAHHSEIQATGFRTLAEGQRVEFNVSQGAKGPQELNFPPSRPGASSPGDFRCQIARTGVRNHCFPTLPM